MVKGVDLLDAYGYTHRAEATTGSKNGYHAYDVLPAELDLM